MIRKYKLSMMAKGYAETIRLPQYDTGYNLVFEMKHIPDGETLTGMTVTLEGVRSDDLKYEFSGTISGSTVTIPITTAMTACAGRGESHLVFYYAGTSTVFATMNLLTYIDASPVPDDAIDADVETARTIQQEVQAIVDGAAATVEASLGTLSNLTTTDKSSVVAAINEIDADVTQLNADLNDISNVVNSLKILSTHNKILNVTAGVSVQNTVHIFDVSITAGQYFAFEAKTSDITSYALYADGSVLIINLIPNEKYCFYASSDISYLSIYTNTVTSTGTIDFELFVLKYVEKTGVDYLTEQIGNMQNKYVAIPHILLSGYLNANGTLGITNNKELHTNMLPVTPGDKINIELSYNDPTKIVWLAYEKYDSLGNAITRTYIDTTSIGGYTGTLVVPNGVSFISITFRTYGNSTFNIYKPWVVFDDIEEEIDKVEAKTLVSNTVKTIAHRGDDIEAPQCTAPAYILARKHGNTIAENDLWLSEDGQFVMWHDTTLGRLGNLVDINGYLMYTDGTDYFYAHPTTNAVYTWNGTDYVASSVALSSLTRCAGANYGVNSRYASVGLTLDVLKRIDFGVYKGSKFKGTQILTFEEWVMLCKKLGMEIYIDKKLTYTDALLTQAANIVRKCGMGEHTSWLGLQSIAQINLLRTIIPDARCGVLSHPSQEAITTYAQVNTGRGFFFDGDAKNGMTKETIQLGLDAGFDVEVWYVDFNTTEEQTFEVLRTAVEYGVTAITTDHYRVDEAFAYLLDQF